MTTSPLDYLVEGVCIAPFSLIVIAGPKKSFRTYTMLAIESAVSQMGRGRYFRIGDTPPEDGSPVHFIETLERSGNLTEATDEEVVIAYNRFKEWEYNVLSEIFKPGPAGVFIDDLDKKPAGLSQDVISMAETSLLTVVSVEADSMEEALRNLCEAAQIDSGPDSPLRKVLNSIVLLKPTIDPEFGHEIIEVEIAGLLGVMSINDFFVS